MKLSDTDGWDIELYLFSILIYIPRDQLNQINNILQMITIHTKGQ